MNLTDTTISLTLTQEFTPLQPFFAVLIKEYALHTANLVCRVPHEVSSIVQLGWEDGLVEDMQQFVRDTTPDGKRKQHDEPGTPFRYNANEHIRTKLIGNILMTLLVQDGKLLLGTYQDLYFFSPVREQIPEQMIHVRVMDFGKQIG